MQDSKSALESRCSGIDKCTPRQRHVDEVIDDLFKEFGTQPIHVGSPSRRLSVSPSHFRPLPSSPTRNAKTSHV